MSDEPTKNPAANEPIYEVEFFGTYHTTPGNFQPFDGIKLRFTAEMLKDCPLSLFSKVSQEIMTERYQDFNGLRKWDNLPPKRVDGGKPIKGKLELMSKEELLDYAKEWNDGDGMRLELSLYNSVAELRTAIKQYQEDPDGFVKLQATQMEKYGGKLKKKKEILELNGAKTGIGMGSAATKQPVKAGVASGSAGKGKKEDEY